VEASRRIHAVDRVLSARDLWLSLCAADIVAVPYQRHVGSSGIVARAARLGRPLLASDYGWVGEATTRYGLGEVVEAKSIDAIARGLERLVASGLTSTRTERSLPYVSFNTEEQFIARWMESIDREL